MPNVEPEPIGYHVSLERRAQHLIDVTMTVPARITNGARIVLPVWTPGSYYVRDYVRHVQQVTAEDASGDPVTVTEDGHTAWRIDTGGNDVTDVTLHLELYANELTVRTNHVDDRHALLITAATFPFVDDATDRPHEVTVAAPDGWNVWSLLPEARDGVYEAESYDHLVDSAFEAGRHEEVAYEVAGVPHRFVWAGHGGQPDLDRIAQDAAAIGEAAVAVFDGDLPVEHYSFLCDAWSEGGGGLEHRDGAVLAYPVHSYAEPDAYAKFQALLAHEYFHLWNVKRLVPEALTQLDYERPVHSPSLWVAEGWTAYYDELLALRSGVWDPARYLKSTAGHVQSVLDRPGAARQSVREASHHAWTKFYVRDENWVNAGISYYEHGAVLAWCLDLLIRRERPDSDGLDEVLRALWTRFGGSPGEADGYTEDDVEHAVNKAAGTDLSDFFGAHIGGRDLPPIEDLVGVVGLRFSTKDDDPVPPHLGVETREDDAGVVITSVLRGGPAWQAGLTGGDRLLALDGIRVGRGDLTKALLGYREDDTVEMAVFRGPRLVTAEVSLGPPRPKRTLEAVPDAGDTPREVFRRWSGHDFPAG